MATKTAKYSDEEVEAMTSAYAAGQPVAEIAAAMGLTPRSVIGKLVHLGVYQAPVKAPKVAANEGPTKAQLLAELAELVTFDVGGLEGCTKAAIAGLIEAFRYEPRSEAA